MWSLSLSLCPPQPSLLRPAGPDGGWTSRVSALLWGGGLQQLGTAPPHLPESGSHPAPAGPGVPQQPAGVPSGRQPAAAAVQPERRQPAAAALRGSAVIAFQGQDSRRGHPGAPPPADRRQRRSINTNRLSTEARLWPAANGGWIWTGQNPGRAAVSPASVLGRSRPVRRCFKHSDAVSPLQRGWSTFGNDYLIVLCFLWMCVCVCVCDTAGNYWGLGGGDVPSPGNKSCVWPEVILMQFSPLLEKF